MVLSFNKDEINFGTVSDRVFAGRHSPSVKLFICVKVHDECWGGNWQRAFGQLLITNAVLGMSVMFWLGGEWRILNPFFFELPIFIVHFVLAVYLEHAIFNLLQLAKCEYANCSENESKS